MDDSREMFNIICKGATMLIVGFSAYWLGGDIVGLLNMLTK